MITIYHEQKKCQDVENKKRTLRDTGSFEISFPMYRTFATSVVVISSDPLSGNQLYLMTAILYTVGVNGVIDTYSNVIAMPIMPDCLQMVAPIPF